MSKHRPATVTVDVFSGAAPAGHVAGWSPANGSQFSPLSPDNATGNFTKVVQRIPVRITPDPQSQPLDLLRPRMSVVATIHTDAASGSASSEPAP